jgi:hypothetical protein
MLKPFCHICRLSQGAGTGGKKNKISSVGWSESLLASDALGAPWSQISPLVLFRGIPVDLSPFRAFKVLVFAPAAQHLLKP